MESLKKELISYGVNGRVLSQIPDSILEQAKATNIAEVNAIDDLALLSQDYTRKDITNYIDKDIGDPDAHVLRLSGKGWCQTVLNGKTKWGPHYYTLTSLLITHPEGISNEEIARELNTNMEQSRGWLRTLRREGLVSNKTIGDKMVYIYSFEVLDNHNGPSGMNSAVPEGSTGDKNKTKKRRTNGSISSTAVINEGERGENLALERSIAEFGRELFKIMKNAKLSVVAAKDLPRYLDIRIEEADRIIEGLKAEKFVKTAEDSDGTEVVAQITLDDVADQIVAFGSSKRIMSLNEARSQIIQIFPMAFEREDGDIVDLFEANGFSIVEVRSKYLPADFIIVDPSISETDDEFLAMLNEVKAATSRQFREKIWKVFFRNQDFTKYDNGFVASVGQRVELFCNHLLREINTFNYRLLFDQEEILRLNFCTFISCVGLDRDGLLYAVAVECAKRNNRKALIVELEGLVKLQSEFNSAAYADILAKACEYLSKYTCGDILRFTARNRLLNDYLRSKMTVSVFSELFDLIVQHSLFQRVEKDDILYFQVNDDTKIFTAATYENIGKDISSKGEGAISIEDRRAFYDAVCECDQEAFYGKAEEYLKTIENLYISEYFTSKLRAFK